MVKNPPANAGGLGSIPGSGRPPGEGNGDSLQYSYLGNPHGHRILAGYSSWGHKALDMTEQTKHKIIRERKCIHTDIPLPVCQTTWKVKNFFRMTHLWERDRITIECEGCLRLFLFKHSHTQNSQKDNVYIQSGERMSGNDSVAMDIWLYWIHASRWGLIGKISEILGT